MNFKMRFYFLPLAIALLSNPATAGYIGDGLYEAELPKSEMAVGESQRAFAFRKAFEACVVEKKGFKIVESPSPQSALVVFRCEGNIDEKLAKEISQRKLPEKDSASEPNVKVEALDAKAVEGDLEIEAAQMSAPQNPPVKIGPNKTKYLGVGAGLLIGLSEGGGTDFTVGGRIGADIAAEKNSTIALGFVGGYARDKATAGSSRAEAHYSYFLTEVISRKAFGTGLYYGLRLGMALLYAEVTTPKFRADGFGAAFTWGAAVGYELPFSEKVHATIDVSLMNVGSAKIGSDAGYVKTNSASFLVIQTGALLDF